MNPYSRLYAVSNVYAQPEIVMSSISQFHLTAGAMPQKWIIVNNHWPMVENPTWHAVQAMNYVGKCGRIYSACERDGKGEPTYKNLGGHGGTTFGLKQFDFEDEDLILNYDLDSWPITPGWLTAMIETMKADLTLGWVALMVERLIQDPAWTYEIIGGHRVAFRDPTEMWNVTLFRGKMFREGMLADSTYYGYVETAMERKAREFGLRHGWMVDFIEGQHPIPHPKTYSDYKQAHARSNPKYPGTFEQWLKEMGTE